MSDITISQVTYPYPQYLESPSGAIRNTARSFGRAPIRLLQILNIARTADIVYVQRVLSPQLMRLLARTDATIVYDIDDAIYLNDSTPDQYDEKVTDRLNPCLEIADAVCVASPPLAEYAHQFCDNIYQIYSPVDTEKFTPRTQSRDATSRLRLGWVGNAPDHVSHLELLTEVLENVEINSPVELRIVGTRGDDAVEELFEGVNIPVDLVEWVEPDEVVAELRTFDIAVMPLGDTPFARAKCPVKTLEYMATGLPIVASAVGMNKDFIVDGDSGRLVSTDGEWEESINILAQDDELREEMGASARCRAVNKYSQRTVSEDLTQMFRGLSENTQQ
jgi:glycosyltransferase involved in cell wall biosynthesis